MGKQFTTSLGEIVVDMHRVPIGCRLTTTPYGGVASPIITEHMVHFAWGKLVLDTCASVCIMASSVSQWG